MATNFPMLDTLPLDRVVKLGHNAKIERKNGKIVLYNESKDCVLDFNYSRYVYEWGPVIEGHSLTIGCLLVGFCLCMFGIGIYLFFAWTCFFFKWLFLTAFVTYQVALLLEQIITSDLVEKVRGAISVPSNSSKSFKFNGEKYQYEYNFKFPDLPVKEPVKKPASQSCDLNTLHQLTLGKSHNLTSDYEKVGEIQREKDKIYIKRTKLYITIVFEIFRAGVWESYFIRSSKINYIEYDGGNYKCNWYVDRPNSQYNDDDRGSPDNSGDRREEERRRQDEIDRCDRGAWDAQQTYDRYNK